MYKLYGYISKMEQLDQSIYEYDIIETMGEYIGNNPKYIHFIVVLSLEHEDIPYKVIHSMEDYIEYLNEYKEKLKKTKKK